MARRNPLCLLLGHKWSRQRLPNRTVRLTCRRCGEVDVVDRDFDVHPGGGGGF
ncbi:MAG: DUF1660 family phage protein [Terrabacter sp.]